MHNAQISALDPMNVLRTKTNLVAGSVSTRFSASDIDAIARIALYTGNCVWHSVSVYIDAVDRCPCAPCQKARKAA